jgi:hypothetical protein
VTSLLDARNRLLINLERVDVLADFTQEALSQGEVADAVEMVGDMRGVIHHATAPYGYVAL